MSVLPRKQTSDRTLLIGRGETQLGFECAAPRYDLVLDPSCEKYARDRSTVTEYIPHREAKQHRRQSMNSLRTLLAGVTIAAAILLAQGSSHAYAQASSSGLPAPKGLSACGPSDPLAVLEARVAAKVGGEFLGCFRSDKTITVQGATKPILVPFEFAIALDFPGPYTLADLDKLLATGIEQWKGFEQLSKTWENYTARLNELIKSVGIGSAAIASEKPVLVSIGQTGAKSFAVISIEAIANLEPFRTTELVPPE
jgi:hypothetical protein